jgi:hypothetical protein
VPEVDQVTSALSRRPAIAGVVRSVVLPTLLLWMIGAVVAASVLHSADVSEYARYAHSALRSPLFHQLPLEYPAPALAVFILPLLLPFSYPWAFAVLVGFVLIALVLSYVRHQGSALETEQARALVVYLALGATMVLTGRYDLFAAAAAFWALRSARRGHWSAAWAWAAVGCLLKLFPAALWPVFFVAEWRRTGRLPLRRLAWVAGSGLVLVGIPTILNRSAALNAFRFYLHRPPEIGSLSSGLSLLFDWPHWSYANGFHAVDAVSPLVDPLATALLAVAALGCLAVWWSQAQGMLTVEDAALATLTLVVLGTKVFSTQYVMWLIPFWALYRVRWSWVAAGLVNTAVFPFVVSDTSTGFLNGHGLAAAMCLMSFGRNVLICVGTAFWLREVLTGHRHAARPDALAVDRSCVDPGVRSTLEGVTHRR